uniref:CBM21 domain-containing protein n=1 Tax=Dendroctonus ponderosae TaxID=77166 RepID=A0AAR5Q914_DENPD
MCFRFVFERIEIYLKMASEQDKCGLSSLLLPISCRDRAEAFARSLQSRLSSLGSDSSTEERSWLGSHESTVALTQPVLNPDAERYLALDILESPCSPHEEIEETEVHKLLNKDRLREPNGECRLPKLNENEVKCNGQTNGLVPHYSGDSDSEVFYDLDDDSSTQLYTNGFAHSQATSSSNTYATSLDCTPQPSVSDELSTLSLKDDISLVEAGSICEDCEKNREEGKDATLETDVSHLAVPEGPTLECRADAKEEPVEEAGPSDEPDEAADGENDNEPIPRVRRCSSLKTGKTPPGTPGRKKIVRFADVLGLDLADIRTFLDEVPKVPKSAYNDLSDVDLSDSSDICPVSHGIQFHGIRAERILVPLFEQPSGLPNFLDLVRDQQVCLENALVEDPILFLIKGTVRVRNLDFHKSVHIRYSIDSWSTYADVQATYLNNSCDGFSDRFSFRIYAHTLTIGQKIEFACRFQCKGCQYWDSNGGRNYCFHCLPVASNNTTTPVLINLGHADWGASFY